MFLFTCRLQKYPLLFYKVSKYQSYKTKLFYFLCIFVALQNQAGIPVEMEFHSKFMEIQILDKKLVQKLYSRNV